MQVGRIANLCASGVLDSGAELIACGVRVPAAAQMLAREFFKDRARGHTLGLGVGGLARPRGEAHGALAFTTHAQMFTDEGAEARSILARQAERKARQIVLSVGSRREVFATQVAVNTTVGEHRLNLRE